MNVNFYISLRRYTSPTESADDKERFIKDVFHCVYVLQKIGVKGDNITIISDWEQEEWTSNGFEAFNTISPRELYRIIQSVTNENLFIITCCHGGLNGIGGPSCIKPIYIFNTIKKNENIQNCLVFLANAMQEFSIILM